MYGKMKDFLANELAEIKAAGLYKNERIITTSQKADIKVNAGEEIFPVPEEQEEDRALKNTNKALGVAEFA